MTTNVNNKKQTGEAGSIPRKYKGWIKLGTLQKGLIRRGCEGVLYSKRDKKKHPHIAMQGVFFLRPACKLI